MYTPLLLEMSFIVRYDCLAIEEETNIFKSSILTLSKAKEK